MTDKEKLHAKSCLSVEIATIAMECRGMPDPKEMAQILRELADELEKLGG